MADLIEDLLQYIDSECDFCSGHGATFVIQNAWQNIKSCLCFG